MPRPFKALAPAVKRQVNLHHSLGQKAKIGGRDRARKLAMAVAGST
jgi:hypothetical protein